MSDLGLKRKDAEISAEVGHLNLNLDSIQLEPF